MKSKTILFFLMVFPIANINSTFAQLSLQNSTSKNISVAVAWYQSSSTYNGYMSKGWYNIESGEIINPGLNFTADVDSFFYYAKTTDGEHKWEGGYKFLTSAKAFSIQDANESVVKKNNPDYEWKYFKKKVVTFGLFEARKYTLNFVLQEDLTPEQAGFKLCGKYSLVTGDFGATILLYTDYNNNYKIDYAGGTENMCTVTYTGSGAYDSKSKQIVFSQDNCIMKCQLTSDGNLNLLSVTGDSCFYLHGMACNFMLGIYYKTD